MDLISPASTVLLLGNGFDLSYSFPTTYSCFLQTVSFLLDNEKKEWSTVGVLFKDLLSVKSNESEQIRESYNKYGKIYDLCPIEDDRIRLIIDKAKDNCWIKFFLNSMNDCSGTGWIDFERTIALVVESFNSFLSKNENRYEVTRTSKQSEIFSIKILKSFSDIFSSSMFTNGVQIALNSKFVTEDHIGMIDASKPDKNAIIQYLVGELRDLRQIMESYFAVFVEKPTNYMIESGALHPHSFLPVLKDNDIVLTFNYTSTYEKIYPQSKMIHIHGKIGDGNTVLGINPSREDTLSSVNTTFIRFKKYFQRASLDTEKQYLDFIALRKDETSRFEYEVQMSGDPFSREYPPLSLWVFGHSLDVTDQDIIEDLFNVATDIQIICYSKETRERSIENIVRLFGKDKYDVLRREKKLSFTLT